MVGTSVSASARRGQLPEGARSIEPNSAPPSNPAQMRTRLSVVPASANAKVDAGSSSAPDSDSKGASPKYGPAGMTKPPSSASSTPLPHGERRKQTLLWSTMNGGIEVATAMTGRGVGSGASPVVFSAGSDQLRCGW